MEIQTDMPRPMPIEVRYAGNLRSVREISSSPADLDSVNKINNGANTAEYADSSTETKDQTKNWLSNVRHTFKNLKPEVGRKNVVGVQNATSLAGPELIVGRSSELGELSAYTYVYDHKSPIVDKMQAPEGTIRKELTFVTDVDDAKRNPEEMIEAMQQTAMMLWESQAGKTPEEFSGSFTPEQLANAKNLEIYASASVREIENVYRQSLEDAGFKKLGTYPYEDYQEQVYVLSLEDLIATMAAKKAAASQ